MIENGEVRLKNRPGSAPASNLDRSKLASSSSVGPPVREGGSSSSRALQCHSSSLQRSSGGTEADQGADPGGQEESGGREGAKETREKERLGREGGSEATEAAGEDEQARGLSAIHEPASVQAHGLNFPYNK